MSRSYRDKKAHKARNPLKYFKEDLPIIFQGTQHERVDYNELLFREGVYPSKSPDISVKIQGKRRRCSTRKGNQKVKQMVRQIDRAKRKDEVVKLIKNQDGIS